MINKPYVGMKVKLSQRGYQSMHLTSEEQFEDAKNLTITRATFIGDRNLGPDGEVWDIEVDKPSINQFMICQTHLDLRD
ncbi:TPA: hypothetical protein ACG0TZ_003373 [Acinetobacter baumannii]